MKVWGGATTMGSGCLLVRLPALVIVLVRGRVTVCLLVGVIYAALF